MAENIGWISIHRQIQNHWIWKDAVKFQWWVDILLTVNTNDAKVNIGFEIFDCKRGESLLSIQSWATRWNTSKDTARNFLKLLEKDNMIKCVSLGKTTRLSVCNFDTYQSNLHVKQTQSKREPNANQTPAHTNNNDNNDNNIYSDFSFFNNGFDKVWRNFKDLRIKLKKPLTDEAEKLNLIKLSKLSDDNKELAIKIVNQSIEKGWQGFFPLKNDQQDFFNQQTSTEIYTEPTRRTR